MTPPLYTRLQTPESACRAQAPSQGKALGMRASSDGADFWQPGSRQPVEPADEACAWLQGVWAMHNVPGWQAPRIQICI